MLQKFALFFHGRFFRAKLHDFALMTIFESLRLLLQRLDLVEKLLDLGVAFEELALLSRSLIR